MTTTYFTVMVIVGAVSSLLFGFFTTLPDIRECIRESPKRQAKEVIKKAQADMAALEEARLEAVKKMNTATGHDWRNIIIR